MLRHTMQNGHNEVSESDFQIIGKSIVTSPEERKFIKTYLSRTKSHQEINKSIPLQLFN